MTQSEKQRIAVICPGRGTYNADDLGYLHRFHADKAEFIAGLDQLRQAQGQKTISELDGAARYSLAQHTSSQNASLLIFACALADFMTIDQSRYEIVAITGNSMGWYLALTCGGSLSLPQGAELVNTMGTLMQQEGTGGQIIYPIVDDNWRRDPAKEKLVSDTLRKAEKQAGVVVRISIRLGGLIIFAANDQGMKFLQDTLPVEGRYPMPLANHAAFHSCLLDHVPALAQQAVPQSIFTKPTIPLIDGRGKIWTPYSSNISDLYSYTLGAQINTTYDFSKAIEVTLKEYAPDKLILLGPGATLGGAIAQEMIGIKWCGLTSKSDFKTLQAQEPYLISMGMESQRRLLVS
ncbi:MAG: ACP S-malonyltransferase [bacterium]